MWCFFVYSNRTERKGKEALRQIQEEKKNNCWLIICVLCSFRLRPLGHSVRAATIKSFQIIIQKHLNRERKKECIERNQQPKPNQTLFFEFLQFNCAAECARRQRMQNSQRRQFRFANMLIHVWSLLKVAPD